MLVAARFCAGLFGTQLLCATWLLLVYGVDLGVATSVGIAGSLSTIFCIVGTGGTRSAAGPPRRNTLSKVAQALWAWSTRFPPRP
jgi:hypothetical protein